jgi:hypothetical protein
MLSYGELEGLKKKRLCHKCIGEKYLKSEVRQRGKPLICSYCGLRARSYAIEEMVGRIDTAFGQHFRRTSDQPYSGERDGEPIVEAIASTADIDDRAAKDIHLILEEMYSDLESMQMGEETEYADTSYYEIVDTTDVAWQEEWQAFERSLKTEARFFSQFASEHLASIFRDLDKMSTSKGRPVVVAAGPETGLRVVSRARVFQSEVKLMEALCYPDKHLGAPPAALAIAGRMNARGISVFYGATDPSVAVAEVRPPVGSRVAVARFDLIRPLRLLDLKALSDVVEEGSVFDGDWVRRLERSAFLRSLAERISRAVMPNDEDLEYLPTQAIADFLSAQNQPSFDGILFPSPQSTGHGLNVVLFHKAARVEWIELADGTKVSASSGHPTGDGWEPDYSVSVQVPPEAPAKPERTRRRFEPFDLVTDDAVGHVSDSRVVALRVDTSSVKVHIVRGVQVKSDVYDVSRHRWQRK